MTNIPDNHLDDGGDDASNHHTIEMTTVAQPSSLSHIIDDPIRSAVHTQHSNNNIDNVVVRSNATASSSVENPAAQPRFCDCL